MHRSCKVKKVNIKGENLMRLGTQARALVALRLRSWWSPSRTVRLSYPSICPSIIPSDPKSFPRVITLTGAGGIHQTIRGTIRHIVLIVGNTVIVVPFLPLPPLFPRAPAIWEKGASVRSYFGSHIFIFDKGMEFSILLRPPHTYPPALFLFSPLP